MTDFHAPAVGDELPPLTLTFTRADLVRYAGASGDFNPIHWSDRSAANLNLDSVIAHGMLTMGCASAALEEWAGDPGRILEYSTRFSRPVPVPDPGEATIKIVGTLAADEGETWQVNIAVTCEGQGVLARTRATVRAA